MLKFNEADLYRLKELDSFELYILNRDLFIIVTKAKRNKTISPYLSDIVKIAETAAKEVVCRKRWSPSISSNGTITYYTKDFRQYLIKNRHFYLSKIKTTFNLRYFSFGEELLSTIA